MGPQHFLELLCVLLYPQSLEINHQASLTSKFIEGYQLNASSHIYITTQITFKQLLYIFIQM